MDTKNMYSHGHIISYKSSNPNIFQSLCQVEDTDHWKIFIFYTGTTAMKQESFHIKIKIQERINDI